MARIRKMCMNLCKKHISILQELGLRRNVETEGILRGSIITVNFYQVLTKCQIPFQVDHLMLVPSILKTTLWCQHHENTHFIDEETDVEQRLQICHSFQPRLGPQNHDSRALYASSLRYDFSYRDANNDSKAKKKKCGEGRGRETETER